MKKINILIITYILVFFNSNLQSNEDNKILKIGLLAPLSGEYKELGDSLLYSLQLALNEIDDKKVFIIPRDSGFGDKEKLNRAIKEIRSLGAKIIIGPIDYNDFEEVKKRIEASDIDYFDKPYRRFIGSKFEQETFFVEDPNGNVLEIKTMSNPDVLFEVAS